MINKTHINSKCDESLFLITNYHPTYRAVLDLISNNWDMLDNLSSTCPLLRIPVIHGFRRPKNLRDLLVRAKLTVPDSKGNGTTKTREKCGHRKCNYCSAIDKGGRICCPLDKRSYITRYNVSCISNNLIYCLYCKICTKLYVGQTKRSLRERIREHFTSIRKNKKHLVVGRHYNLAGHSGVSNVLIYILDFVKTPPSTINSRKKREALENKRIFRLRSTVHIGLNLAD